MTLFWLYATLLCAAAVAFVLWPLLRRDRGAAEAVPHHLNVGIYHERLNELTAERDTGRLDAIQFEAECAELTRQLLADAPATGHTATGPTAALPRRIPLVVTLSMPLLALTLYQHWGALDQVMLARQSFAHAPPERVEVDIADVATRLEALLAETPDSAEGWSLLARAYRKQGREADAARASARASTLAGLPVADNIARARAPASGAAAR